MADVTRARWFGLSLAAFLADQASKYAVEHFTPEAYRRTVIPGFFDLVHTHNPGVAFGILSDAESPWVGPALILFSTMIIAGVAWMLALGHWGSARRNAGLALILGGAFGNLVDRLLHDGVLDFADFYVGTQHWPAFNVADSCIVVGAGLVMLEVMTDRSHVGAARPPMKQ